MATFPANISSTRHIDQPNKSNMESLSLSPSMGMILVCTLSLLSLCAAAQSSAPDFVTQECSKTRYPKRCMDAFRHYRPGDTPPHMLMPSITATSNEISRCHSTASSLPKIHPPTTAERTAWADCLELFQVSLSHLNICASAVSANSDVIPIFLSAALTNMDTCVAGFTDLNCPDSSFKTQLLGAATNASEMISNSLSLYADGQSRRRRRLLWQETTSVDDEGFPRWVSKGDRRLLQSSSLPSKSSANVVVAKDGSGTYSTISAALNAAPTNSKSRYVIYIKAGTYEEQVTVGSMLTNIAFVGDGAGSTIITGSKNVQDGSTTFQSATVAVSGAGFIASDITFRNTAGAAKHQAVALRVGADKSVIYSCNIEGYQDTLYTYSLRQFYKNCNIYGTVDFIFGNAAAVIQSCNIYARAPMSGQFITVTAQGRSDPNENTGISVHRSTVAAAESLGSAKAYLGRPWKQYSRTVFMLSSLGSLIDPAGWHEWDGNFALDTLYYGEYQNSGAGASTSGRVTWKGYHVITSSSTASQFTASNFISGDSWLPSTGVPYTSGL